MSKRNRTLNASPNKIKPLSPKTESQEIAIKVIEENTISILMGNAGVGKTYLSAGMAIKYLLEKKVSKILLCRPTVGVGKDIGFLPGDIDSKLEPFLRPLFDELCNFITKGELKNYQANEIIEITSLHHIQGRTFKNAIVILDEAENCTEGELKMFLTRLGEGSKYIITADPKQSHLHKDLRGGLVKLSQLLEDVEDIETFYFQNGDSVRHPLIEKILSKIDPEYENGE